jgi:hypothetical protein
MVIGNNLIDFSNGAQVTGLSGSPVYHPNDYLTNSTYNQNGNLVFRIVNGTCFDAISTSGTEVFTNYSEHNGEIVVCPFLADTAQLIDSLAFEQKINEAIMKNNTIVTTETWEENRKAMNELYLRTIARSQTTFSAAERQMIYSMAIRCPYSDGEAIYLARTMFNLIEPTAAFDDDEICNAAASFKKEQARKAKVQPLSVTVSPNPASTEVDIVIKGSQENMRLTITNNVGEVISQSEVNHYVTIDVSQLPNGIYFLSFLPSSGDQITSKLIIAK